MRTFHGRVEIVSGDITTIKVDAIVNAANSSLLGGGGVDGAIHQAAGPMLYEECRQLKGCATGEAKITKGYQLPAKYVIHTVGPIWKDGKRGEHEKLAKCYQSCFDLAVKHGIETMAFPAISTGAYAFPMDHATRIALVETKRFLSQDKTLKLVTFICWDARALRSYMAMADEVLA